MSLYVFTVHQVRLHTSILTCRLEFFIWVASPIPDHTRSLHLYPNLHRRPFGGPDIHSLGPIPGYAFRPTRSGFLIAPL